MTKPKRSWRWLWRSAVGVGCLLAIALGVAGIVGMIVRARLRQAWDNCRAQGLPTSVAEVQPAMPPPADNAAQLYRDAVALGADTVDETGCPGRAVGAFREAETLWASPSRERLYAASAAGREQIRPILADPTVQEFFAVLTAARARPRCVFPPAAGSDRATAVTQGRLQVYLDILVKEDAIVAAMDGDTERAVERLLTINDIVDKSWDWPKVYFSSYHDCGVESFQRVVAQTTLTAEQLAAVQASLVALLPQVRDHAAWDLTTLRVVAGMRVGAPRLHMPEHLDVLPDDRRGFLYNLPLAPGREVDMIWVLRAWEWLPGLLDVPLYRADMAGYRAFEATVPEHLPVAQVYSASLGCEVRGCALLEVRLQIAIAGAAVLRYRAARGAFPPTLDALVPQYLDAVPLDPRVGAPLQYRRRADGWDLVAPDSPPTSSIAWHYTDPPEARR